jgi:predicted MFS family arabinose efflux permease
LFHLGADADQLEESAQGASGVPVDNIAARWHSNPVGHIHAHPSITANRGFEPNTAKRLMATLGFSAAIGSLLVPALSDRVGRKPVIVGFSVLGVILPVEAMYLTGGPWALAALFFVGWGVCWSAGATFAEQESKRCAPLSCRVFASH